MKKRRYKFQGTRKEIGRQVGELYRSWGRTGVTPNINLDPHFPKQKKIYQKYYPEYLDYLSGVARGLGLKEKDVVKLFITVFAPLVWKKGCSTFALKNNNGVIVGRNYDWRSICEKNSAFFSFKYKNSGYSFNAVTDMGIASSSQKKFSFALVVDDGWNEKGLYISTNGSPSVADAYGLGGTHMMQLVLEKCANTSEALEIIKKVPIVDTRIFTVADKKGNFAIVEKIADKETKVVSKEDYIFTTNHFNHPDLEKYNLKIFKNTPFHSTFARYQFLKLKLEKDYQCMTLNLAMKLLAKQPLLQEWRGSAGDAVTCWSTVVNLISGRYKVSLGPLVNKPEIISSC